MAIVRALDLAERNKVVHPEMLALQSGLKIQERDDIEVAGFMVGNVIVLRKGINETRRQWLIACCLGHWVLGHRINHITCTKEERAKCSREAETFALALHSFSIIKHIYIT